MDGARANNPWINKYIFPGAYCPALKRGRAGIERSGLLTTDIEVLRLHYAETLRHWRWRFAANRDAIAALYDERFCRMLEFYLSSCELGFRTGILAASRSNSLISRPPCRSPATTSRKRTGSLAGPNRKAPTGRPGSRTGPAVHPGSPQLAVKGTGTS